MYKAFTLRKSVFFFIASLVVFVLANGGLRELYAQTLPAGLVAAYGFNEGSGSSTTADLSGNGNTGTISGATWTTSGRYHDVSHVEQIEQRRR